MSPEGLWAPGTKCQLCLIVKLAMLSALAFQVGGPPVPASLGLTVFFHAQASALNSGSWANQHNGYPRPRGPLSGLQDSLFSCSPGDTASSSVPCKAAPGGVPCRFPDTPSPPLAACTQRPWLPLRISVHPCSLITGETL